MSFLKKFPSNSVNSQIVIAFVTLTSLIIVLEVFANSWIREMIVINSLNENLSNLQEKQMQLKSASNEFILREKTNENFFASGQSKYINRYQLYLRQLVTFTDAIRKKGGELNAIDEAELINLKTTLVSYNNVFNQMVEKIKLRGYGSYGLIGEFDKSIRELLKYDFGADGIAVLNLQIFVKNYLLTGDANLASNISDEIYRFTMVLEKHVRNEDVDKVSNILFHCESTFKHLTEVDRSLGIYTGGGLQSELFAAVDNLDRATQLKKISNRINGLHSSNLTKLYASFFLVVGAAVFAAIVIKRKLYKTLVAPIQEMKSMISSMSRGEVPKSIVRFKVDDLNEMANALNNLVVGTRNYQEFANNIGRGNLDVTFTPLSEKDILGSSLLAMKENLKKNISDQHRQMLELQRVNDELDNFTYHASHDLRAPLTTIQGLVNLGLKEQSPHAAQQYFEMIQNRVVHMDSLLKDLISVSYNNKTQNDYQEFDFQQEVNTLLKSVFHHGHNFDIELKISQPCRFVSDPVRIRTILGNLLSNAVKYFNPDVSTPCVKLKIEVNEETANLTLADNGIGIDYLYREKIFNMFFRATTRSTGTGLGLYIVKSMVERLEGQISFESVVNEGTTFFVEIPNRAME